MPLRLVVTGGGTGGHVYPALEVARLAAERGIGVRYAGSLRGQESAACSERGLEFAGFCSEPLYSLTSLRGWRALLRLQAARGQVRQAFRNNRPDVVFSTGGYSAGPVVAAARDLAIPYIVHSADSVPPRSSAMFAREAFAFTTLFRSTPRFYTAREVVRTGQPIRRELRSAADSPCAAADGVPLVLVLGGSQGSEFLNRLIPQVAALEQLVARFLHVAGPRHVDVTKARLAEAGVNEGYKVVPYLETPDMVFALRSASVVVSRSGGTVAELALFGLPSVLIPLPSSANDHQLYNAREFEEMGAASVFWQPEDRRKMAPPATPEAVGDAIATWLSDGSKRAAARHNLKQWDVPTATEQIVDLIERAADKA